MSEEILIVGAGPVGLSAAVMLAMHKIPFRIIDKKLEPTKTSNALGIHIRTLEVLGMLGVVDDFLAAGEVMRGLNVFSGSKLLVHLDFSHTKHAQYHHALALPQSDTEHLLIKRLQSLGADVDRGVALENLEQTESQVKVSLLDANTNERQEKQYKWVLACDGAHSTVREILNVPFVGSDEDNHFIMMDCKLEWDRPHDEGHVFLSRQGVVATLAVGKTYSRVIVDVMQDPALKAEKNPSESDFTRVLRERDIPFSFKDVTWVSGFWIKHRHVENFQHGRVFYLGDSAHVHSPVGGQGMNTGIQDAYNLTWKLAMVYKRHARPDILKTYNQERLPNAMTLLKSTKRATRMITLQSPWKQKIRNFVLTCVNKLSFVKSKLAEEMAELNIQYNSDIVIPSHYKDLKAGQRMPNYVFKNGHLYDFLSPTQYTLLYKNIDVTGLESESLRCIEFDKDEKQPLTILIRPDQYIESINKFHRGSDPQ